MARETKIGLVVGLGFIVCFAIILSNRGAAQGASPRLTYRTEPEVGRSMAPYTSGGAERRARELGSGRAAQIDDLPSRRSATRTTEATPWTANAPDDARNALVDPDRSIGPNTWSSSDSGSAGSRTPDDDDPLAVSPNHLRADTPNLATEALEEALRSAGTRGSAALPSPRKLPPSTGIAAQQPSGSGSVRRHVIAKGDTLWKIAERYYGVRSKQTVDAIFQANRTLLKDPKDLIVGQELILPGLPATIAGTEPDDASPPAEEPAPAEVKPAEKPAKKAPSPRPEGKGWRWYQIKDGDRYASIARQQLGSRNRWAEIHELNKDLFPDPARIRTGVKIRVPDGGGT